MRQEDLQIYDHKAVENHNSNSSTYDFLTGGGEMGERIRTKDWSKTPLGPVEQWPQSLQTIVRIMLTSRQPIWIGWGPELIKLYNDPYKAIVGGKHPHSLGQPAEVVWHDIWQDIEPMLRQVMEKNEGTYVESQLLIMERYGYPEETYYTFSYNPVPSEQGGVGGMICTNTDDTGRVIGERQLALLRSLAAETADARTLEEVCRSAARSFELNPYDLPFAMIYLLDEPRKEVYLAGITNFEKGHPAVPERVALDSDSLWPFKKVVTNNSPELITELGNYFDNLPSGAWQRPPTKAVAVPIASPGEGGHAGVLIVGLNPFRKYDESYQGFIELLAGQIASSLANAQAYEEERKRAEALAEIDRAKTTFFSNVSHEFRTPLTLMLGPIEDTLAEKETLTKEQQERTEILHRNSLRLLRLVNALLDFSRIEAGRVQAFYEPVELASYTAELASSFRSAIEKAGMQLVVEAPPLQEAVYIDREMWEKIVLNLLSNAFKYTLKGSIKVSLKQLDNTAELTVSDTGVGIPEAEMAHLFERFHRVEGVEGRTHEGTGIGLALVQELVKLHSGTITAKSILGEGTTFTITVPLGSSHLPSDRISGQRTRASTATGSSTYVEEAMRWLDGRDEGDEAITNFGFETERPLKDIHFNKEATTLPRILLADDNADMREYVKRLLSQKYAVETVPDGKAALTAIAKNKPDLVLSDVMMPKLDGFGLLKALREDPTTRSLPVILLSARAGEEARIEGLEEGADDYLVKPFSARELIARIGAHLALSRVRQQAQEAIQKSRDEVEQQRKLLYQTFMQAPVAISVLAGPDLVYELVNPITQKMIGNRLILGKPLKEAFPELSQEIWDNHYSVYQTGETFIGKEFPSLLDWENDGKIYPRYWDFVYEPRRNEDGKIDGVISVAIDVTEQIIARQRVEEQNRVLEMITSGASLSKALEFLVQTIEKQSSQVMKASILLLDEDGKHLRHGAAPSLPKAYNEAIDGIEIGPAVGSCGTAAYTKKPVIVSNITTDPLWLNFRELAQRYNLQACWSTPIYGSDQAILGTFAMYYHEPRTPNAQDQQIVDFATRTAALVIERKKVEAAILHRSEQLRHLAQAATRINAAQDIPSIIRIVTEEARLLIGTHQAVTSTITDQNWAQAISELSFSDKYAGWKGYEIKLDGFGIYALVCKSNRPMRLTERELETHPAWRKEANPLLPTRGWLVVPLVGRDGRNLGLIQLSDKYHGEFDQDDEAILMQLAQLASIALENQKLYEQEQAARLQAEEASRLKDEFLATVSHELRTPLTAFLGYTQMLKNRKRDEAYIARTVDKLIESARSQAQLIEDLLDISRVVSGKLRIKVEPIDFITVINSALDTVRPAIEARNLDLRLELNPAASSIMGDTYRLQQVVWNLLSNATKFTPLGGQIQIRLERHGNETKLEVSDTGQGISSAFLPFVFDRFRQADGSSTRAQNGLGLGLAIVRHLVELHGGTVQAASAGEGQGATFTVTLPLAFRDKPANLAEAKAPQDGDEDGDCPSELRGLRVLLVDDQPDIVELLSDILASCGAVVRTCESARKALEQVQQWQPDILITDIAMPGEDGYWLIQNVRSLPAEAGGATKAIALTAYVRMEDRLRVLEAGFEQYIPKPVEPAELRTIVARLAGTTHQE